MGPDGDFFWLRLLHNDAKLKANGAQVDWFRRCDRLLRGPFSLKRQH